MGPGGTGAAGESVSGGTSNGDVAGMGATSTGAVAGGGTSGGSGPGSGGAESASGSAGAGGAASLPPLGPAPEDKPDSVEVGVRNNCPFSIWIHGEGKQGVLLPDYHELQQGEHVWYDAPKQWESARITAFGDAEHREELDKVEMTFIAMGDVLNYNITYVDWLSLPVEMRSRGAGDCQKVGCYVPEARVLSGCPDGLLDGRRCMAARTFCAGGQHAESPYCHALDGVVQACAATKPGCEGAVNDSTANAYACDRFFGGSPKWCAAVNRGMLEDPESVQSDAYYRKPPYNTYSKWVHEVCPGIYAFPYDDYPPGAEASGFHACAGGKELEVTFCPAG